MLRRADTNMDADELFEKLLSSGLQTLRALYYTPWILILSPDANHAPLTLTMPIQPVSAVTA